MDTVLCYGPPGTGKTTRGVRWVRKQLEEGADPGGIAFISFTNAACDEARRRVAEQCDLYEWELEYCATIHALCRRALRIEGRDWLAEGTKLKGFAEEHGYDLQPTRHKASEDLDEFVVSGGKDGLLLAVWNFGRNRLITDPDRCYEAYCDYEPDGARLVPYTRFMEFVPKYEGWKTTSFLRDYTDLPLDLVKNPQTLPLSIAVVDEAQDMTLLLWAAADILTTRTAARVVLGDDDQSIYGFQGAAPELLNQRPAAQRRVLAQSYRLPRRVWELAQRVIRQNRNRVEKPFQPRPEAEGSVARVRGLQELDLLNGESWMLLTRNWAFVPELTKHLESEGIPYRIQGEAYCPWSDRGPLRAVQLIYRLSEPGGRVRLDELAPLLEKARSETKERPGAWAYGAKTKLRDRIEQAGGEKVGLMDLPHLGLTEWGFDRIALRDLALLEGGVSARDLAAYQAAQRAGTWGRSPAVVVSTIHGVKGQEADNVAALMACTGAPARNLDRADRREEEIRLAYVGITRARQRFFGIDPSTSWGYPYEIFGV